MAPNNKSELNSRVLLLKWLTWTNYCKSFLLLYGQCGKPLRQVGTYLGWLEFLPFLLRTRAGKKTPKFPWFCTSKSNWKGREGSQIENHQHFFLFRMVSIQQICAGTPVCLTDLPVLLLTPSDSNRALTSAVSAEVCFVTAWKVSSAK